MANNRNKSCTFECTDLYNVLNDMSKKVQIEDNLSEVLDILLERLKESEKYMSKGIITTNFAEAALILQQAAFIYGKKVDALWELTLNYHERIITQEKNVNKHEVSKLEERINRNKRKKRKINIEEENPKNSDKNSNSQLDEILKLYASDKNNNNDIILDAEKFWQEQEAAPEINIPQLLFENNEEAERCIEDTAINVANLGELLHNTEQSFYDPPFCDYFVLPPIMCTVDSDLPGEEITFDICSLKTFKSYLQLTYDLEIFRNVKEHIDMSFTDSLLFAKLTASFMKKENVSSVTNDNSKELFQKFMQFIDDYISRDTSADTVPAPIKDRRSTSLSTKDLNVRLHRLSDDLLSFYTNKLEHQDEKDYNLKNISINLCRLPEDTFQHYTNKLKLEIDEMESGDFPNTQDSGFFESSDLENMDVCGETIDFSTSEIMFTSTPKHKEKLQESKENTNMKKAKRFRLEKVTLTTLQKFEKFYRENYRTSVEEGEAPIANCDTSDGFLNESDNEADDNGIINSEIEDLSSLQPATTNSTNCNTTSEKELPLDLIESMKIAEQDFLNSPLLASKYRYLEWRAFILKKLKTVEGNADFDIHEYEEHIVNKFPESKKMKLDDFMAEKSSSLVTKYFLASLQLANNYNIEFNEIPKAVLANHYLEMKLLSSDLPHKSLKEYVAPSVTTFAKRVKSVQEDFHLRKHPNPVKAKPVNAIRFSQSEKTSLFSKRKSTKRKLLEF